MPGPASPPGKSPGGLSSRPGPSPPEQRHRRCHPRRRRSPGCRSRSAGQGLTEFFDEEPGHLLEVGHGDADVLDGADRHRIVIPFRSESLSRTRTASPHTSVPPRMRVPMERTRSSSTASARGRRLLPGDRALRRHADDALVARGAVRSGRRAPRGRVGRRGGRAGQRLSLRGRSAVFTDDQQAADYYRGRQRSPCRCIAGGELRVPQRPTPGRSEAPPERLLREQRGAAPWWVPPRYRRGPLTEEPA